MVRTLGFHPGSRGSIPRETTLALLAQLVEHRTLNPQVVGSIPTGGTKQKEKKC
jgi:hypothetical protein